MVPAADAAATIVGPVFRLPAVPDGRTYTGGIELTGLRHTSIDPKELARIARKYGAQRINNYFKYYEEYARMLAKIAHAIMILTLGPAWFEEVYVIDAILGRRNDVGRWVGNDGQTLIDDDEQHGHTVKYQLVDGNVHVRIKLFDWASKNEHVVVVGRPKKEIIAEDELPT